MQDQPANESQNKNNSLLFIDSPEEGKLVLGFDKYAVAISNIIQNSTPNFTVGIFGEWGSGKTTLMNEIKSQLNQSSTKKPNMIQFNPWRYQNETYHATIPLLWEILNKIPDMDEFKKILEQDVEDEEQERKDNNKKEKWGDKIHRILKGLNLKLEYKEPLTGLIVGANYDFSKKEPAAKKEDPGLMSISEATLETPVLQEGIESLKKLMKKVTPQDKIGPRLVIFIDDLDRCTPEKAVEVFESIKVFFDINGIVFVLGLSKKIVESAINTRYESFKKLFKGEDYLKKNHSVAV